MNENLKVVNQGNSRIEVRRTPHAKAPASAPTPVKDNDNSSLLALLKVEADARAAETEKELQFLIANESRKLARARQVFVLRRHRGDSFQVKAVSSLDAVDRNAPLIQWIERISASPTSS